MEPITLITLAALVAAVGAVALRFWDRIVEWVQSSLFPWFDQHLPTLAPLVREGFMALDRVAVEVRRRVREVWYQLRPLLLKITVTIEKNGHRWIRRTTSYVRKRIDPSEPVHRITEERVLSYDELPDDVRASFLRTGGTSFMMDVTKERDREIDSLKN